MVRHVTHLLTLTRGDCLAEPRPCARKCPYRLDGAESCALDVADRGGTSQYDVARLLGLSETRVQQIEREAVARLAVGLGRPVPSIADYATVTDRNGNEAVLDARDAAVLSVVDELGPVGVNAICTRLSLTRDCVCGSLSRLTARGDVDRDSHRDGASLTYLYRSTASEAAE